ncbi:MAG: hypothetical protein QXY16_01350, partial [Nanopusillaceae archaeon]
NQNIPVKNLEYNQLSHNYSMQQNRPFYPEEDIRTQFQNIYENVRRPIETREIYNQSEKIDYSYDWESYIQGIVEDILKDKFSTINNFFSEIKVWREKLEMEISKINEKIRDIENRINGMYEILAKKIDEYDKGIKEATVEVEALHRLIRTMVPAISESTKELKETIEEIKQLRDQLKKV